jgi:hypothetical protein
MNAAHPLAAERGASSEVTLHIIDFSVPSASLAIAMASYPWISP